MHGALIYSVFKSLSALHSMYAKINYYRKSVLRFSNINLKSRKFDEARKQALFNQWRSQGRVPGVPEPPLRDIAIAKSREKILLEPPFNSARLEK